jgi:hypothetical protein
MRDHVDLQQTQQPVQNEEKHWSWRGILFLSAILASWCLVLLLVESGVNRLWPGAPAWLPEALIVIGVGLVWLTLDYVYERAKGRQDLPPFGRYFLLCLGGLLILGLLELGSKWLSSTLPGVMLFISIASIALFGLGLIWIGATILPIYWVSFAVHQADYATALNRTAWLQRRRGRNAETLFIEGTVQFLAGHLSLAEALLCQSLAEGQRRGEFTNSVALENLGCVLLEQGRYDEALQKFEDSLKVDPKRGGPYNSLGEIYLRQGIEPQRALELIDQALRYKRATWRSRTFDRHMFGEIWGNRAWALALLNRERESNEAIQRGFQETDRKFKPALAGLHWRTGQARRLLGDTPGAIDHFQQATRSDPIGLYGHLAAQALHDLPGS